MFYIAHLYCLISERIDNIFFLSVNFSRNYFDDLWSTKEKNIKIRREVVRYVFAIFMSDYYRKPIIRISRNFDMFYYSSCLEIVQGLKYFTAGNLGITVLISS